jgi:hypothetical protein
VRARLEFLPDSHLLIIDAIYYEAFHILVRTHSEDGGNKVLRNVGILTHYYTVSHPRRPRLDCHVLGTAAVLFYVPLPPLF